MRRFGLILAIIAAVVTLAWLPRFGQTAAPGQQLGVASYLPLVFQAGEAPGVTTIVVTATPSSTPTASQTATATATRTSTPTQTPVPVALIPNGDFEQGATGWQLYQGAQIVDTLPVTITAHSGRWAALVFGAENGGAEIDSTFALTIPVAMPYLSYWVWVDSDAPSCSTVSGDRAAMAVFLNNGSGPQLADIVPLCQAASIGRWTKHVFDLRNFAGADRAVISITAYTPLSRSRAYFDDIGFQSTP